PGRRRLRVAVLMLGASLVSVAAALGIAAGTQSDVLGAAFLQHGALDPPFSVALVPVAHRILLAAGLGGGMAALAALARHRQWVVPVASLLAILDLVLA